MLCACLCTLARPALAQEPTNLKAVHGFVDFNGYWDSRDFYVLTYNISLTGEGPFQYFSLTNYQSPKESFNLETFYAEHNLRWKVLKNVPLQMTAQYVIRNAKEDHVRLGVKWNLHQSKLLKSTLEQLNLRYSINPMFIDWGAADGVHYATTIEHVFFVKIAPNLLNDRLYMGGFADQNLRTDQNGNVQCTLVSEQQLGVKLTKGFYAVVEYRINEFVTAEPKGIGYGIEYKVTF